MMKGVKRGNFLNDLPEMQSLQMNKKNSKMAAKNSGVAENTDAISEQDFPGMVQIGK